MLKQVIFIFAIILLITVGLLDYQRSHGASTARFLALNSVSNSMYNNQPSDIIFIHPKGTVSSVWRDDLFTAPVALQWSEDGQWLYFAGFPETKLGERDYSATKILRFNTQTAETEVLATGQGVFYSQSSAQWAYNQTDSIYNSTGQDLAPDHPYIEIVAAPQSEWLIYVAEDPNTSNYDIWRVRYDGTGRQQITNTVNAEGRMAVSADSEWIAYHLQAFGQPHDRLEIINVYDTTPIPLFETNILIQMAWSSAAKYLIYVEGVANPNETRIWLVNRPTQQRELLVSTSHYIDSVLWSLDGKWLYFCTFQDRSQIEVYRVNTQTKAREFLYQQSGERLQIDLSWSPAIDQSWHPLRLFLGGIVLGGLGLGWLGSRSLQDIHAL